MAATNLVAIAGPQGAGKSRLALEALNNNVSAPYAFRWWIRAPSRRQLISSIEQLAEQSGSGVRSLPTQTFSQLLKRARQPALVVIDDIDDIGNIRDLVASSGEADVLVTSTHDSPGAWRLPGLSASEDVIALIERKTGLGPEDAERLLATVEGNPLLVLHACHFVVATGASISEYEALLGSGPEEFETAANFLPIDYELRDRGVIPLSIGRILDSSSNWEPFLRAIPVLGDAPIPRSLLRAFDSDADSFLAEATATFAVSLNPVHSTIEVPSLVRRTLAQIYPPATASIEFRYELTRAIKDSAESEGGEAVLGYLADHLFSVGRNSFSARAAMQIGGSLPDRQRSLKAELLKFGYECFVAEKEAFGETADDAAAKLAGAAALDLYSVGRHWEAERILWPELSAANARGSVECRAPLLHVLGHIYEDGLSQGLALSMFEASLAATRIAEPESPNLGRVLADVLRITTSELARTYLAEDLQYKGLLTRGIEVHADLTRLRAVVDPAAEDRPARSEVDGWASTIARWERVSDYVNDALEDSEWIDPDDAPPEETQAGVSLSENLAQLEAECLRLARRSGILEPGQFGLVKKFLECYCYRDVTDPAGESEARGYIGELQDEVLERHGASSTANCVPDFLTMLLEHSIGNSAEAAAHARAYSAVALGRVSEYDWLRYLHVALVRAQNIGELESNEELDSALDSHEEISIMGTELLDQVTWLQDVPEVESLAWVVSEATAKTESPDLRAIRRAIGAVRGLGGDRGLLAAGNAAHLFGHRAGLDPSDSLSFHRISAGLLRSVGEHSLVYGYALQCYAHRLLDADLPDAASRRFKDALEILGAIDGKGDSVEHIEAHLTSPIAPFLQGENRNDEVVE